MQTKAAVLWDYGRDWEVDEMTLDDPREGEVLIRLAASGLCHSDEHLRIGDLPMEALPAIGGHEGAGVVEAVGAGVRSVAEGDHVVLSFIPVCGRCHWCAIGRENLCDYGVGIQIGLQRDGIVRHHMHGQNAQLMCNLGTFSSHTVVHEDSMVKIDQHIPLDKAALVCCGVTTGKVIGDAISLVGKGGKVTLTALSPMDTTDVQMPIFEVIAYEKQIIGCLFKHSNPRSDIPKMLSLYRDSKILLNELITRTYTLEQINDGYEDMRTHRNIRGLVLYE